ncbi:kinase-like domain-containing protein [Lasiosphaeria miniovina]|uniref:Kinase-like domain-containing protein n=1 Tax=Lasiosphaeria miniovina TaxID=1954250 RepID=A0AA40E0C5_9PEZI|nr:kinase-like domain-containing protein [Lasiosphaeria miniovina]KAK0718023.1 kinase-like domain-containing protein [Lasiosphaeria miniovina]
MDEFVTSLGPLNIYSCWSSLILFVLRYSITNPFTTSAPDKMPKPVTSSKEDVVTVQYKDLDGNMLNCIYYRWVLSDAKGEDELYYAIIPGSGSDHTVEQIDTALERMLDERIFFPIPIPWYHYQTPVTIAATPEAEPEDGIFLKRPWLAEIELHKISNIPHNIACFLAAEVRMLERLSRFPPHPNIVRYHGCRARRGRVTGIQLGRVEGSNLFDHVRSGRAVDKAPFLAALASAVDHLHRVVGIAHKDLHPLNVMVSPDGRTPTIVDFGSADVLGAELRHNRHYTIWGEDSLDLDVKTLFDGLDGNPTSRRSRDLACLKRLAAWIDDPVDMVKPEVRTGSDAGSDTHADELRGGEEEAGRRG